MAYDYTPYHCTLHGGGARFKTTCAECRTLHRKREEVRRRRKGIAKHTPSGLSHMHRTTFYNKWVSMKTRCSNPESDRSARYFYRGISVSTEWQSFTNFYYDMYASYLEHGERFGFDNTTIERVDNDGNYSKENCRWATRREQSMNRSSNHTISFNGKTQTLTEWANERKIKRSTLGMRLTRYGWDVKRALAVK